MSLAHHFNEYPILSEKEKAKNSVFSLRSFLEHRQGLDYLLRRYIFHEDILLEGRKCISCDQLFGAHPQSSRGLSRHHVLPKRYYYRCPAIIILCRGCHHSLERELRRSLEGRIEEGRLASIISKTSSLKLLKKKYVNPNFYPETLRKIAEVSCETANAFLGFSLSKRGRLSKR